jgi:hypothetical protein
MTAKRDQMHSTPLPASTVQVRMPRTSRIVAIIILGLVALHIFPETGYSARSWLLQGTIIPEKESFDWKNVSHN